MAALAALLPQPINTPTISDYNSDEEEDVEIQQSTSTTVTAQAVIPPYGQRQGWRPSKPQDFADGGAYPECHIAQYPLEMGKKKVHGSLLCGIILPADCSYV